MKKKQQKELVLVQCYITADQSQRQLIKSPDINNLSFYESDFSSSLCSTTTSTSFTGWKCL